MSNLPHTFFKANDETLEYRRDNVDRIQIVKSLHNFDQMKLNNHFTLDPEQYHGHSSKFKHLKCLHNVTIYSLLFYSKILEKLTQRNYSISVNSTNQLNHCQTKKIGTKVFNFLYHL